MVHINNLIYGDDYTIKRRFIKYLSYDRVIVTMVLKIFL